MFVDRNQHVIASLSNAMARLLTQLSVSYDKMKRCSQWIVHLQKDDLRLIAVVSPFGGSEMLFTGLCVK
jgi:hypothetical protein